MNEENTNLFKLTVWFFAGFIYAALLTTFTSLYDVFSAAAWSFLILLLYLYWRVQNE